jgi:uncharacterized membrane protein
MYGSEHATIQSIRFTSTLGIISALLHVFSIISLLVVLKKFAKVEDDAYVRHTKEMEEREPLFGQE